MVDFETISKINPYSYTKILMSNNNKNYKEDENEKIKKVSSAINIRQAPRVKSALLFDAERELKRVTLSSKSFSKYMKMNQNQNRIRQNRQLSSYALLSKEKEKEINSQRTIKHLPNLFYKKLGIKESIKTSRKDERNKFRKKSKIESNKVIKRISINKDKEPSYVNFNNILDMNDKEDTIKEMPYGFKYKDTRIIYDKNKIQSTIFSNEENNNLYNNITNIKESFNSQKTKSKKGKKFPTKKEKEKEKNSTFKFFFEGDFLEQNKSLLKKTKKREFVLKNEEAIDYLNDLYEICKNIEKFNARDSVRQIKYDLKKYYHRQDFSFEISIQSLCLKFYKQDNKGIIKEIKPQKLFLPFTYLLFFYLLDFETFKFFLSEIIIYNEEKNQMEINQKEIRDLLVKYKKYIQFNLGPFFNKEKKEKFDNYEKYEKITYNCHERSYLKIYDWIIHMNSNHENENENVEESLGNKNIMYKVKMILPMIKYNLITKKLIIKKYIHKNIITDLLKSRLDKWEEKILCDLFFNKKFRYIMNSIFSQSQKEFQPKNKQKIYLDRIDYNQNILNKYKYEFFITDAKKEHSKYYYISSYKILLFYGRTNDKFFYDKQMNIKECINLNKFSIFWGYVNTIIKCLHIDKSEKKAFFDFKILENSPTKFFKLKLEEGFDINENDKTTIENLKNFYNMGYIPYRKEELLIDMYLINLILVQPSIVRLNLEINNYKIPKELLNIITTEKNAFFNMHNYISQFSKHILSNKGILNLNLEDFKRRVYNKNLNKGFQERLKTFSMGIINKTSTFKNTSSNVANKSNNINIKRGISGNFGSLFGKSLLNLGDNYNKSNTKKFGGSIFSSMKSIEEKKEFNPKIEKKVSIWKRISSKKKTEEKNEIKDFTYNNENKIIDFQDEPNEEENIMTDNNRKKKKSPLKKNNFTKKAEFFKAYIDAFNKKKKKKQIIKVSDVI